MAEFSIANDVRELAQQLRARFAFLSEVDLARVVFLRSSGGKKKDVDVKGVRAPYSFISNYKFIVTVYQNTYDTSYNDNQRKIALLKGLMKIEDFEEGSTKDYDIKGFLEIEGTYGVQWNLEDSDVPDILETTTTNEEAGVTSTETVNTDSIEEEDVEEDSDEEDPFAE